MVYTHRATRAYLSFPSLQYILSMKIALISYWSCPLTKLGVFSSGGMSVYVLNLANQLGSLGHQVDIYTRVHHENDEKVIKTHKNVRIIHLSSKQGNLYVDVDIYKKRLQNYIEEHSLTYDVIHAHYFYSGLIGIFLKLKFSFPLIQTFHTLGRMKELRGGVKDPKRVESEMQIINSANAIIASTEIEESDLITYYHAKKNKIFVIQPGVNHKVFRKHNKEMSRHTLHLPESKHLVLFVGRIDPIKGISLLIQAVGHLTKIYPQFINRFRVLLIGGDVRDRNFWKHPEVKRIKQMIAKNDLECCIKFIGSRPHNMLPYYYSAADVVVMPSSYESFGLVVLEAMACASVVLASKVGGLKYLITDCVNGRLFYTGNVEHLGMILWELLHDTMQRKRLSQNAQRSSEKFCWEKQANKILSVYRKLS